MPQMDIQMDFWKKRLLRLCLNLQIKYDLSHNRDTLVGYETALQSYMQQVNCLSWLVIVA